MDSEHHLSLPEASKISEKILSNGHTCEGHPAADQENLEEIPDNWRASEISYFFTGRPNWGLFASVYPCLWGEVADNLRAEEDRARALAQVKSKDFLRVVEGFRRAEGIAPHPAVAYRILEAKVKEQSKRAKVSSRASTPRSGKKRKASAVAGG